MVASGIIDCFLTPENLGRERKVILAMKIIVAGLKSREIHEKNVINSLQCDQYVHNTVKTGFSFALGYLPRVSNNSNSR